MNFKKFAKSVAPMGHIYSDVITEWLTDGSVFMVIPTGLMMPGQKHDELPDAVKDIIHSPLTEDCFLSRAVLPEPDSKIKDAQRIYSSESGISCNISNDAWSLIEPKKDRVMMIHKVGSTEALGIVIINMVAGKEAIVGAILTVDCEV